MKFGRYPDIERIAGNLSDGEVIAVVGPDLYQSKKILDTAVDRCRRTLEYDIARHDGGEFARGDLRRMLTEISLFAGGRLIVISSAHRLGKHASAELLDALASGFDGCAIFLYSSKLPRDSTLLSKLEKLIPLYICYEPFERDMKSWVKRIAAEKGARFTADAVRLLAEYSGRNLTRLHGAVSRIALYHDVDAEIDGDGVLEVISGKGGMDVFRLGDMLFRGRRGDALDTACSLLLRGEDPIAVISFLFGFWRKIVVASEILGRGGGRKEVSSATGAGFPLIDKLMSAAGTWNALDEDEAAEAFAEADHGIKTGADPLVALAGLIFTLTRAS